MANRWCRLAVILVALPLGAGTIDVSAQVAALLDTGDELSFKVPSWNYSIDAAAFGLPAYPTEVGFVFVSAPVDSLARIDAVLESGDGSVSVAFGGPLSLVPGTFHGFRYSGPVSVLEGSLQLSETLAQQVFGNSPAVLTLIDTGPALTVGLAPYTLQEDMNVSLGSGGLSVGAPPGGVALVEAPLRKLAGFSLMDYESDPAATPEPCSGMLLPGGIAMLWALARLRPSKPSRSA